MAAPAPLTLVLTGDVMLGRIVDESFLYDPTRTMASWGNVVLWLEAKRKEAHEQGGALVLSGNLECAITSSLRKNPKAFNFALRPQNVAAIRNLGFDFLSTANNHTLDYFQEGLEETMKNLDDLGVAHAGAGRLLDARKAVVVRKAVNLGAPPGRPGPPPVAFISFSDHYEQWAATPTDPGINYVDPESFDPAAIREQLHLARSAIGGGEQGLLVVNIHWGPNWRWEPEDSLRRLGRCFIESGADIVFGHSAHHVQGVELYKGKPIVYSAGSLIDDYAVDDAYRNDLGCIYVLSTEGGRPRRLEGFPCHITHTFMGARGRRPPPGTPSYLSQVNLAESTDFEFAAYKIRDLSAKLGTKVDINAGRRCVVLELPQQT